MTQEVPVRSTTVEIRKDVPPPTRKRTGYIVRTLERMQVGDSAWPACHVYCPSWYAAARRLGMRVTVRRTAKGTGIWRTA